MAIRIFSAIACASCRSDIDGFIVDPAFEKGVQIFVQPDQIDGDAEDFVQVIAQMHHLEEIRRHFHNHIHIALWSCLPPRNLAKDAQPGDTVFLQRKLFLSRQGIQNLLLFHLNTPSQYSGLISTLRLAMKSHSAASTARSSGGATYSCRSCWYF